MGLQRVHKVMSPYHEDDLPDMDFEQTSSALFTASLDKPVMRLLRNDHTSWVWEPVVFGPSLAAPAQGTVTANQADGAGPSDVGYSATNYEYVITSISDTTGEESRQSPIFSVSNDLTLQGNSNRLTLPAHDGDRIAVYRRTAGVFGYIGATESTSFDDQNIIPDTSNTPPQGTNPFDSEGNYPSTLAFHEQRLFFGRSRNNPNAIWASQSTRFTNMDKSFPARGDDALEFSLLGRRVNAVNSMVSSINLLALTSDSIFSVTGAGDNAIGPDGNIQTRKQGGSIGAARLDPIEIDNQVFYTPLRSRGVRVMGYTFNIEGFQSSDISIFSSHLFERDDVVRWAYQAEPNNCIWAVMRSGTLLCFTWERDQDVWGWTVCDMGGVVEDITVVDENNVSRVYLIVRRNLNGQTRRFYERMALPPETRGDLKRACPVDCAVSVEFETPTRIVRGLDHLEGATVTAYADGFPIPELVVLDGQVDLGIEVSVASVGLPFVCSLTTLPPSFLSQEGSNHGNRQTGREFMLRTYNTRGLVAKIEGGNHFEPMPEREGEQRAADIPARDVVDYKIPMGGVWSDGTCYVIEQQQSIPGHLLAVFPEPDVSSR